MPGHATALRSQDEAKYHSNAIVTYVNVSVLSKRNLSRSFISPMGRRLAPRDLFEEQRERVLENTELGHRSESRRVFSTLM